MCVCVRIIINFWPLFAVVSAHNIILLWSACYGRHSMVPFINFPSLNAVRNLGPQKNKKSDFNFVLPCITV